MTLTGGFEPREYQRRIAETATASNTLVVLPTGLGKTMIAILVAASRLEKFPEGKVLVMAPTKPLTLQHYESFRAHFALPPRQLAVLTGATGPTERTELWTSAKLLFATPQTDFNDVKNRLVSLRELVLAVFDEAHRSVRDYSYTQLAKLYAEEAEHPLILGLTASPGGSREKVQEIKRNLYIDRVESRSEEDQDVRPYVERTATEAFKVPLPEEYQETISRIREIFNEKITRLRNAGFLRGDRVSKKMAQAVVILHALEVLETQGASSLSKYLERLREKTERGRATVYLLKDPRWTRIEEEAKKIRGVAHPKLERLVSVIRDQLGKKKDSKVIVFTQYRDTIDSIIERLDAANLDARRFVGQADRAGDKGMDQRLQTERLEMFREGRFPILVSSSIGEEGLHVPDVDIVVFYEAVPSEIRSIQRRGRTGRTAEGRVVILLAEGTIDESYYYSSIFKENRMRRLVSASGEEGKKPRRRPTRNPTLLDFVD
ncbi:MAG: DEAD/DEAH box helicase [Thaumarchaeota archaeon]|nr:MAG: DEAD/DEAH box helicase [Nitrososphaerota archaeon]